MIRRIERASAMLANHLSRAVAFAAIAFLGGVLLPFTQARAEPLTNWYSLDQPGDHVWGTCEEALPTVSTLADIDTCKDAVLTELGVTEHEAYSLPVYTTRFTITLSEEQVRQKIAELKNTPLVQPQETPETEVRQPSAPQSLFSEDLPEDFERSAGEDSGVWIWLLWLMAGFAVLTAGVVSLLFFTTWKVRSAPRSTEVRLELVIAEGRAKGTTREQRTLPIIVQKVDEPDGSYRLSTRIDGLPTTFVGYNPKTLREEARRNVRTINERNDITVVFGPNDRTESLFEGGGKLPRLDELFTTEKPITAQ